MYIHFAFTQLPVCNGSMVASNFMGKQSGEHHSHAQADFPSCWLVQRARAWDLILFAPKNLPPFNPKLPDADARWCNALPKVLDCDIVQAQSRCQIWLGVFEFKLTAYAA